MWDTEFNNAVLLQAMLGDAYNIKIRNPELVDMGIAGFHKTVTVADTNLPVGVYLKPNYSATGGRGYYNNAQTFRGVDWGDGSRSYNTLVWGSGGYSSEWKESYNLLHTYSAAGTYTVRAICLDGDTSDLLEWEVKEYTDFRLKCTVSGQENNISFTANSPAMIYVNFGDSTTWEEMTATSSGYTISHNYSVAGDFAVTIRTLGLTSLRFSQSYYGTGSSRVYYSIIREIETEELPAFGYSCDFKICSEKITSIPSTLFARCTENTSFASCFYGCSGLTSLPDTLFADCTAVTSFAYCFSECTGLTSLPDTLFADCTAVTSFYDCFSYCEGLEEIPANLFAECTAVTEFIRCFYRCEGLQGDAPALWEDFPNADGQYCFYDCTGLDNYAEIPSGWR